MAFLSHTQSCTALRPTKGTTSAPSCRPAQADKDRRNAFLGRKWPLIDRKRPSQGNTGTFQAKGDPLRPKNVFSGQHRDISGQHRHISGLKGPPQSERSFQTDKGSSEAGRCLSGQHKAISGQRVALFGQREAFVGLREMTVEIKLQKNGITNRKPYMKS